MATKLQRDYRSADLPPRERSMLEYVERLTLAPWDVGAAERKALELAGWHPVEVTQIVLGCAHFNYLNRMADGLGIRFEYATQVESFVPGRGAARREEIASAPAGRDLARTTATDREAENGASGLEALLSDQPAVCAAILRWREFQLRGTAVLTSELRGAVALYAAAVEYCESAVRDARNSRSCANLTPERLAALASGVVPTHASDSERRVLEHARRLLAAPATLRESDLGALREVGFDDREIVRLTMLVAYLAFEHRVRCGLRAG